MKEKIQNKRIKIKRNKIQREKRTGIMGKGLLAKIIGLNTKLHSVVLSLTRGVPELETLQPGVSSTWSMKLNYYFTKTRSP